jgi:hypothetical protein
VDPLIDLAPGADDNALAVELAARVRENLASRPEKASDFRALRGSVLVVLQDEGEALTLRFDHGRLTIHEGHVGIPVVTFCGDAADLRRLSDFPITRWFRLPVALPFGRTESSRETFRHLVSHLAAGNLKVYGLLSHPRLVTRFLRIVSRH